jgi:hypothetical protein
VTARVTGILGFFHGDFSKESCPKGFWCFHGNFWTECFPKRFLFFDGNVSKECFPKSCLLAVREGLLLQYLLFERVLKCISAVPATFQNIS